MKKVGPKKLTPSQQSHTYIISSLACPKNVFIKILAKNDLLIHVIVHNYVTIKINMAESNHLFASSNNSCMHV